MTRHSASCMAGIVAAAMLLSGVVAAQTEQHGPFDTAPNANAGQTAVPVPVIIVGGTSSAPTPVQRPDGGQLAQDGTDATALSGTAIAQGTNGVGIRGWLATIVGWLQAIYTRLGSLAVTVSNFPATQAVSATALPLPAGAATSANQPPLTTPGTPGTQGTTVTAVPGTFTYAAPASSAITTGGTAQNAATAGSITHGCDLQNPTAATEPLYYNLAGAATTAAAGTTFALTPGQPYHCPFPTTQALSVNAATTGHAFSLVVY